MQNTVAEWMIYGLLFTGLLSEAVIDVRKQKIWIPIIILEIPLLLGLNYFIGRGSIMLLLASFGMGGAFYLISVVTKGQLGKGDALLFAMTGAGVGFWGNVKLIYFTFLIAFFAAAFLWLIKKKSKDYQMPLAPFILAVFCLSLIEKLFYNS